MLCIDTLKDAIRLVSLPMLVADKSGRVVLANSEFNHLFGYGDEELSGESIDRLVPAPFHGLHREYMQAFMRVPAKRSMGQGRTLSGVTKSGEEIPLELALNTVSINGQSYSLVAAVDVRVRLSHQRKMELAMEAATTAMVMADSKGDIVLINGAALALSGYSRDELLNHSVENLIHERIRAAHRVYRANFNANPDQGTMAQGRMVHLRHKSGKLVPVDIALTPVSTPEGDMVMSTMTDLTERIAAESAMRAKNQELGDTNWKLAQANRELTQFAYAVSHDLKAPLSSLRGLLELIREDIESGRSDEIADYVARCQAICERSSTKVERILKMSHDSETQPASRIRLNDMTSGIWDAIAPGADVPVEITQNMGVNEILTRPDDLEVVLHNLLSNAVKFNDPKKGGVKVAVTSRKSDQGVEIAVVDNGIGIPDALQEDVFQMFRRVDKRSGDGIGLALVRKHMGRLGGKITLKSQVGQGSAFQLTLPQNGESITWKS